MFARGSPKERYEKQNNRPTSESGDETPVYVDFPAFFLLL